MPNAKTSADKFQELAKSAQQAFVMTPFAGHQSTHFWQAQDKILQEFEQFSANWFKRRHVATRTAVETTRQLAENALLDPAAAMHALADWQTKSLERLGQDAREWTELMSSCAGACINNELQALEESVETTKQATKKVKSDPV